MDFNQPAITSAATTDVAHMLTMLTAQAVTAVLPLATRLSGRCACQTYQLTPASRWNARSKWRSIFSGRRIT
ncbi:hypothetical protein [Mycobacterium uberis]|uniref:hypothetical protein n=1 Tax=Mycobacterium uberis TaxID=2162698 RepID=UPI0014022985|nr:hypothetical protein [Mycobacterium uberis]